MWEEPRHGEERLGPSSVVPESGTMKPLLLLPGDIFLTRGHGFAESIDALLSDLRAHSPQAQIVLLGIPPMQAFPLLPQPLRAWLGGRSRRLEALGIAAAQRRDALHSPIHIEPAPELFASDGFHPSELGHARWAEEVHSQLQALPWRPLRRG